jgi:hypothetical protein
MWRHQMRDLVWLILMKLYAVCFSMNEWMNNQRVVVVDHHSYSYSYSNNGAATLKVGKDENVWICMKVRLEIKPES